MTENETAKNVVDAAYKIHTKLGPGLLESAYQAILAHELRKRGLNIQTETMMPVNYAGVIIDLGYRADIIVEGPVIN